jgi:hypothetical protein
MTMMPITPICIGCKKVPSELAEYCDPELIGHLTPDEYVRREEGTYNPSNGHFACTSCYIKLGQPTRGYPGWKAP